MAHDAGWQLDWRLAAPERHNEASRAAMERSVLRPLREMFDGITTVLPGDRAAGRAAFDVARLVFGQPATEAIRTKGEVPKAGPQRPTPGALGERAPGIGD